MRRRDKDVSRYEGLPFIEQLDVFFKQKRRHAGKATQFLLEHDLATPEDICKVGVTEYEDIEPALTLQVWKRIQDRLRCALQADELADPAGDIEKLVDTIHKKRLPPGY